MFYHNYFNYFLFNGWSVAQLTRDFVSVRDNNNTPTESTKSNSDNNLALI